MNYVCPLTLYSYGYVCSHQTPLEQQDFSERDSCSVSDIQTFLFLSKREKLLQKGEKKKNQLKRNSEFIFIFSFYFTQ